MFYESPHRILRTLKDLANAFGSDRPASVSRELSKFYEETLRGDLTFLATHVSTREPRGEFVVIVGGAVEKS